MKFGSNSKSASLIFSLVFAIGSLCAVVVILISALSAIKVFHDRSMAAGASAIEDSVLSQLVLDTELLTETLARNLRDPLYKYDLSRIRTILSEVSKSQDVVYLYIADNEGLIVHDGSRALDLFGSPISEFVPSDLLGSAREETTFLEGTVHLQKHISVGDGAAIGTLYLGFKDDEAREKIAYFSEMLAVEQNKNRTMLLSVLILVFFFLVACALPLSNLISKRLLKPVFELAERSRKYAGGDLDQSFKLDRNDEFGDLGLALDSMVSKLDESRQKAWNLAHMDILTELPNRRYFHEKLENIIEESSNKSEKFAMFFIDLDFFKQVNDACGHDIGDLLLKAVANRITTAMESHLSFHAEVSSQNHLVSRISGDEFVLILPIVHVSDAKEFADNLYERFGDPIEVSGRRFTQSISTGITYFPHQATSSKQLMKNADLAMYQAKSAGRSGYCEFNEVLKSEFQRRSMIKQSATAAFESDQFFLEYQPIFNISDSSVIGAEALVRWAHPDLGRLWPSSFIHVFDENGLTTKLALWVLENLVKDFEAKRLPQSDYRVSINISSRVFLDSEFHTRMIRLLNESNFPRDMLCIELAETDLSLNVDHCRYYAKMWQEEGVSLWIDDFGGVSSSLVFLNELPVDAIKISGSILRDLEKGKAKAIVQAIQSLARALEVSVIASGIESQAQLELMLEIGCELAQGFCLGSPLAIQQLPSKLDQTLVASERF